MRKEDEEDKCVATDWLTVTLFRKSILSNVSSTIASRFFVSRKSCKGWQAVDLAVCFEITLSPRSELCVTFCVAYYGKKRDGEKKGKRQNRLPKTQRSGVMWFWWREYNKRGLKGSGYNWQRTVYCHWRTRTFIFEAIVSPHYKSPRCSASFEVFQHVPRCSVPWCPVPKCLRCLMSSRMRRNIAFLIQCVQRVQGVLKCFEVYHGVPFQARFGCLSVSQLLG